MTLCVALLIASEFMPVSLLTPIAEGLHSSVGMTGQAISVSGFFAMMAGLMVSTVVGRINRKTVLIGLTLCMLMSLVVTAIAPNFTVLMIARAALGICIGGFWALATSVLMRLVPHNEVNKALGIMYMGQAMAAAFAAPLGSYLGGMIGWRGVFWALVPIVLINLIWQLISLPSLPSNERVKLGTLSSVLMRPYFLYGIAGMSLTFAGAFTMFTYLRPYLEQRLGLQVGQISLMFLVLGCAGFIGSSLGSRMAKRHVLGLVRLVPAVMATVTLCLLWPHLSILMVAILLIAWGAMNTALSIGWMGWMSQNVRDQPEAAGSLMVAAIQGAILIGSALGGKLMDIGDIPGTLIGSVVLLALALVTMGSGKKLLKPA
ncbi:Purine ribonucleoside efflux pump NepI [Carnimonas sp. R-84981]